MGTTPDQYVVYVLACADGSLYVGMTCDLARRLSEHRRGTVCWTRSRLPLRLVHTEQCAGRAAARHREKYLKSGGGKRWLRRVVPPGN